MDDCTAARLAPVESSAPSTAWSLRTRFGGFIARSCFSRNHSGAYEAVIGLKLLCASRKTSRYWAILPAGTGEMRDALAGAGHTAVIKPPPLRPAVPGGFTIDDFSIDEAGASVTWPAGHTRMITPTRNYGLRRCVRRLPATRTMHHLQDRPQPAFAPSPRHAAPSPPPGPRRHSPCAGSSAWPCGWPAASATT
jgi:hypothetical protein